MGERCLPALRFVLEGHLLTAQKGTSLSAVARAWEALVEDLRIVFLQQTELEAAEAERLATLERDRRVRIVLRDLDASPEAERDFSAATERVRRQAQEEGSDDSSGSS